MDDLRLLLKDKKIRLNLILITLLVLMLPIGIILVRQAQVYFSRAEAKFIEIAEGSCVTVRKGVKVLTCADVPLKLINPFLQPSPTPTPTPTPTGSGSATPTPPGGSTSPTPSGGSIAPPRIIRVNGNTDVEIQAALREIQNSGGGVYLPAGTYTINNKIKLYSNTTIFGDGPGQTILQATQSIVDANDPIMSNDSNRGQENVTVRDLTVKGLGSESGKERCCPGLRFTKLNGGYIINVEAKDFSWNGIYLGFQNGIGVSNVRVSGNRAINNKGAGIALALGNNNVIDNNIVSGNNFSSDPGKQDAAINLEIGVEGGIKNNKVLGNQVTNNENAGISLKADPGFEVSDNAVCNNTSTDNGDVGIADAGGQSNVYIANRISNNQDRNDGKIVICDQSEINKGICNNLSRNIIEDEGSGASNATCSLPNNLKDLPSAPAKPSASITGPFLTWINKLLPNLAVFAQTSHATGTISASPNPCTIAAGADKCSITLTWSVSQAFHARVRVKETNQILVQDSLSGNFSYTNVTTSPQNIELIAYDASEEKLLANVAVSASPPSPTATPTSSPASPTPTPTGSGTPPPPATECSDSKDNDSDTKIDAQDPECHTDFKAENQGSYDPNIKYESFSYRLSESEADLPKAEWKPFGTNLNLATDSARIAITNFTLSDETPGPKQIWVEFRDPTGKTIKDHITFNLAEKDPEITALNCTYDLARQNVKVAISGKRFGQTQGNVAVGTNLKESDIKAGTNNNIDILSWAPEEITFLFKNGSSVLQSGQSLKVGLIREDDGKSPLESCQVDQSSISLGARVFCREAGKFDVDNVKVSIFYNPDDSKSNQKLSKVDETVTISKDGFVQGLKTKLQSGKNYALSILAPNSLRRNAVFKASDGTTIVSADGGEPFILPIGDIAPVTNPDGQINALDRAEITRQWRILGENNKKLTGDFNRDSKVNSIDWACMRFDFNSEGDTLPTSVPVSQNSSNSGNTVVTPIEADK